MSSASLVERRDRALGAGAPLFYNTPLHIVRGEDVYVLREHDARFATEDKPVYDNAVARITIDGQVHIAG